jgi:hypothetical protein
VANRGTKGGNGNHGVTRRRAIPEGALGAICKLCGVDTPIGDLFQHRLADGTPRPSRVCMTCHRRKAREQARALTQLKRPKRDSVDLSPDSRPAVRVRAQLQRDRAAGLPWSTRRFIKIVRASCATSGDGYEWRAVIEGQAVEWRRGYLRTGPPILSLSPSLFDDRSEDVVEYASSLVA